MSISRHFDSYIAQRGIVPVAEVIPECSCQVFEDAEGVRVVDGTSQSRLDATRNAVQDLLG
ncbi:hypothetical protein [Corynebacterium freiburgense]|uniref:hypothetical protein n=1 Tax=Corynebacterium freiburgense TaxID=556548 RepID=UPI00040C6590|nr:hypothetical protein [Corynebacterium freiburgense]WJZ03492.1 hypothetical protein CFREI_11115 [Corynebacterium freiburgense]